MRLSEGNTAEVLEYGEDKVCKLFFERYPEQAAEIEYQNAKEVFKLGLDVPKPFELITFQNRRGIIYERVEGKTLASFMEKNNSDEYFDLFINLHKKWLSYHFQNGLSYKEFFALMLVSKGIDDESLLQEINELPDGDRLLHGDFHPNNIMIRFKNEAPVIIDFLNVCYGPALYDIARTFFLLGKNERDLADRYLEKMNVLKKDIAIYLNVIEKSRQYE